MSLSQTTEQQRSRYYNDLRELLNPGFIAHPINVNGTNVVMRSLTPGDFFLLRHRAGTSMVDKTWKTWTIAMAIWMVDGQVLLGDQEATYRLYEMCVGLPRDTRDDLFSVFTGLMNRVNTSMARLEAYLYEGESRYLWKSEGTRTFDAGVIPGVPKLGMNPIQKVWTFFNDIEDEQERKRHEWAIAKFNVSPHAPKGIKKLNASDAQHEQTEKVRRQRVQDIMCYRAQGIAIDDKNPGLIGPIHSLQTVSTVEEMQESMRNWVAGKRDPHDEVVLATKANIRRRHDEAEEAQRRRIQEVRAALDEEGIDEPAFSPLLGEARQKAIQGLQRRRATVYQEDGHNSAYNKYIKDDPEVGLLAVQNDRLVVNSSTAIPYEELIASMRETDSQDSPSGKSSLTDRVKARGKPTMRSTEGE